MAREEKLKTELTHINEVDLDKFLEFWPSEPLPGVGEMQNLLHGVHAEFAGHVDSHGHIGSIADAHYSHDAHNQQLPGGSYGMAQHQGEASARSDQYQVRGWRGGGWGG